MLAARAAEIGRIETLDNGKPIFESQFVDTPAAAECLYYFAGWSGKVTGETIPIADNAFTYTLREPVGVVGAITPWNFPLMLAVWKIAPALACGNTVVIKPASNTSLSLLKFAEYAKECGLARRRAQRDPRTRHPSSATRWSIIPASTPSPSPARRKWARELMARAAKTLKKVSLELGGKSPNIVFADADLEAAARGALNAIFYGKGEVCAAGSRLLVEESAHDELMAKVTERANKMVAADPLHPKTRLGAIVSKEQMETVLSLHRSRQERRRETRRRRRARRHRHRQRLLRQTDDLRRRRGPIIASPAKRSSAPSWPRSASRMPRMPIAKGERHGLRPGRRRLDARHLQSPPHRPRHQSRHGLDQHLQPLRSGAAVRRLQGVGLRPRSGSRRAGEVHADEERVGWATSSSASTVR